MIKPFPDPPLRPDQITKEHKLKQAVRLIGLVVTNTGGAILRGYNEARSLIHENPQGLTANEIYAALGADAADLQKFAIVTKTMANFAKPGVIDDSVPEAKITMPG
jgi:hypothetical protein